MAKKVNIRVPNDPAVLGYIAGIVDGEGCLTIRLASGPGSINPSHNIKLTIGNTDPALMVWLIKTIGGTYRARPWKKRQKHHKLPYDWDLYGSNLEALLRAIQPFLQLKKQQADLLLELAALKRTRNRPLSDTHVEKNKTLLGRIRVLNQRGS